MELEEGLKREVDIAGTKILKLEALLLQSADLSSELKENISNLQKLNESYVCRIQQLESEQSVCQKQLAKLEREVLEGANTLTRALSESEELRLKGENSYKGKLAALENVLQEVSTAVQERQLAYQSSELHKENEIAKLRLDSDVAQRERGFLKEQVRELGLANEALKEQLSHKIAIEERDQQTLVISVNTDLNNALSDDFDPVSLPASPAPQNRVASSGHYFNHPEEEVRPGRLFDLENEVSGELNGGYDSEAVEELLRENHMLKNVIKKVSWVFKTSIQCLGVSFFIFCV